MEREYPVGGDPQTPRISRGCDTQIICALAGCAPQNSCTLRAAPPNLCTWGLRAQTSAVASLLDYNVVSFTIHM